MIQTDRLGNRLREAVAAEQRRKRLPPPSGGRLACGACLWVLLPIAVFVLALCLAVYVTRPPHEPPKPLSFGPDALV